ncbi:MAG: hypothetical protein FK731_02310 [Asgard group archaeon]|nr:hypothetical protein [Asgard group archaeon]
MIAITKEFKKLLQEIFDTKGITEIPTDDLVDVLNIDLKELELLLKDTSLKDEFKLVRAEDSTYYVKRFLQTKSVENTMVKALKIRWDNIGGCPCFTCYELDRCDIGNPISSVDCPLFTKWLFVESEVEEK